MYLMKLINNDLIVRDALVDLLSKRHCVSASKLTERVVQSGQEPHPLNIEICCQRKPD